MLIKVKVLVNKDPKYIYLHLGVTLDKRNLSPGRLSGHA